MQVVGSVIAIVGLVWLVASVAYRWDIRTASEWTRVERRKRISDAEGVAISRSYTHSAVGLVLFVVGALLYTH